MQLQISDIPVQIESVESLAVWALQAIESRVGNATEYDPKIVNTSTTPIYPIFHNVGKLQAGENSGRSVYRYGGWFWLDSSAVLGVSPIYSQVVEFKPEDQVPTSLLNATPTSPNTGNAAQTYELPPEALADLQLWYTGPSCTINEKNIITAIPSGAGARALSDNTESLIGVAAENGVVGICPFLGTPALSFPDTFPTRDCVILLAGAFDPTSNLTVLQDGNSFTELRVDNGKPSLELFLNGTSAVTIAPPTVAAGFHLYVFKIDSFLAKLWVDGVEVQSRSLSAYDVIQFDSFLSNSDGKLNTITDLAYWAAASNLGTATINQMGEDVAAARSTTWTAIS